MQTPTAQLAYAATASTSSMYKQNKFAESANFSQLTTTDFNPLENTSRYFTNYQSENLYVYPNLGVPFSYSNAYSLKTLEPNCKNENLENRYDASNRENTVQTSYPLKTPPFFCSSESSECEAKQITASVAFSSCENGEKLQIISPASNVSGSTSDRRYREKREKNNAAAKQSRCKRREREKVLRDRVEHLQNENQQLKEELAQLRQKLTKMDNISF